MILILPVSNLDPLHISSLFPHIFIPFFYEMKVIELVDGKKRNIQGRRMNEMARNSTTQKKNHKEVTNIEDV